ncbi:MAG: ribosome maturation factor RimP [bacterium]|nr:MAG: ribosome maturation factor RimP [bacterium]
MNEEVITQAKSFLAPILEREGVSLYDMEFASAGRGMILRIFIDSKIGVTHNHCVTISKQLSALLEVEELIKGAYTLEVSSPGITRKLKKPDHYAKSVGSLVRIVFKKDFHGPHEMLGKLQRGEGERFVIVQTPDGGPVEFGLSDVARARLEIEP